MGLFSGLETETYDRKYSDIVLAKRIWKYLSPYKFFLLLTGFFIIVGSIINVVLPDVLTTGIDELIGNQSNATILGTACIYFILGIFSFFVEFGRSISNSIYSSRGVRDIRDKLFSHIMDLDQSFYDQNRSGKIMSRVANDSEELDQFLQLSSQFVAYFAITLFTLLALVQISLELTLISLIVLPGLIFIGLFFRKYAKKLTKKWRESFSNVNTSFQEGVSGVSVAKSFGRIQKTHEKFFEVNKRNYFIGLRRAIFFSAVFPCIDFFSTLGIFSVLTFGPRIAETANLSPGTLLLFVLYLQRFYFPIVYLTIYYQYFQSGLAATERVFSLLDVLPKIKDSGITEPLPLDLKCKITFDHVSFGYIKGEWVFRDFNLVINSGEKLAIVGHTGAGKTTITALIMRFYDPQEGRILLDDIPITNFSLKEYRKLIAAVFQDSYLFDSTILENIRYGNPGALLEEIYDASMAVHAHQFIMNLPQEYNTPVGERGNLLSSGQRQLIAFARSLVATPRILILDEATANVDVYTEAQIQDAIDVLLTDSKRTSITIAHRLTTIEKADRIIVLENGRIIEEGTHQVLLENKGHYSELYKTYFEHQRVDWEPEYENHSITIPAHD